LPAGKLFLLIIAWFFVAGRKGSASALPGIICPAGRSKWRDFLGDAGNQKGQMLPPERVSRGCPVESPFGMKKSPAIC